MRRQYIDLPKGTIDETGHTHGDLQVRTYAGTDPAGGGGLSVCECECGQHGCLGEAKFRGAKLRSRRFISCGRARANPDIRQVARLQTSAARRKQIAELGAASRWGAK